ncbi:MAG TPA: class IV lanthionine synthetase LanL, partial [Acidimicrobiia bacterium]
MDVAPLDVQVLSDLTVTARALLAASGAEWRFSVEGPWALATPVGARSPEQGWKLHVSATEASAADVLAATIPVLVAEAVPFKFAAGPRIVRLLNSTHADRASGGKFLTVYPADDEQAVRLAEACHRATAGLAGPVVLSDRAYRPGSLVHYRYGGFSGDPAVDADGLVVHLIKGPDGALLPDDRSPSYRAPSWLTDPFQPAPATAPSAPATSGTVVLNGRYGVQGALSHANKGGTYLAEDTTTGQLVVIKEGRPHVGDDGHGDARARVRHEARMLSLVEPLGRSPRLVEVFEQGGHVFLVEEYVDAPSLREVVEGDTGGPAAPLPPAQIVGLASALAETLAAFHAAGVVVGDFNPNNILVTDDGAPGGSGGKIVLIDLEHARRSGDAPGGPAGTPGYASPEQLRGEGTGPADDRYALGATIAYLATGADPFLPAGVDDTWSDPARLAAWLDAQVVAGVVDPTVADVALAAMAPRPTDRLSPAAVLSTLRGEGSRTAPGRGGSFIAGHRPPTPVVTPEEVEAQAAEVVVDLGHWLLDTMGTGPAGHLWPAGAAAASLDPVAVQAGASGVGLFLAQLLRAAPVLSEAARRRLDEPRLREVLGRTAAWVADQLARNPQRPPGLYFGTSGVAWFLAEAAEVLSRADLLRRANELALALPVRVPNSDITHGTAGIGIGQLRQWQVTGDDRFLARAVVAAEQVLRAAVRSGPAVTWPVPLGAPTRLAGTVSYGYAHGNAGIATFLYATAAATGETEFAAVATDALLTVLPQAVVVDGAAYWPASPEEAADTSEAGYWPSWCNGSSGMGTAFLRAHLATGDPSFRRAAEAAAQAGLRERWRSSAVQCHGLAGDAELLLDLAALPDPGPARRAAVTATEALLLQRRTPSGGAGPGVRGVPEGPGVRGVPEGPGVRGVPEGP